MTTAVIIIASAIVAAVAFAGCKSSVRPVKGSGLAAQGPEPLEAVSLEPTPGRAEVGPLTAVRISFSASVDPASLGAAPIVVTDLVSLETLEGGSTLEGGGKEIVFRAADGFQPDSMYRVDVSRALQSTDGGALAAGTDPTSPRFPAFYSTFSDLPDLSGDLAVTDVTSSSISLAWSAGSDNSSPDGSAIVYNVYLARTPAAIDYSGTPEKQSAPGATSDVLTRLDPGVEFRLALRARDAAGNLSAPSNEVVASTKSVADQERPIFAGVARLDADPLVPHSLTVVWEPGEDRPDPATPLIYNVYVALETGKQNFVTPTRTSPAGATSLTLDGLASDTEYFVVVRAMDPSGNEDTNTVEAPTPRRTPVSFSDTVFKILTLPNGYDVSLCWPVCTNPLQPGGCARARCHTANNPAGGYNLTTYAGVMSSSARGPRVVPGMPQRSLLRLRMRSTTASRMPQGGTCNLFGGCLDAVDRWILQGALDN